MTTYIKPAVPREVLALRAGLGQSHYYQLFEDGCYYRVIPEYGKATQLLLHTEPRTGFGILPVRFTLKPEEDYFRYNPDEGSVSILKQVTSADFPYIFAYQAAKLPSIWKGPNGYEVCSEPVSRGSSTYKARRASLPAPREPFRPPSATSTASASSRMYTPNMKIDGRPQTPLSIAARSRSTTPSKTLSERGYVNTPHPHKERDTHAQGKPSSAFASSPNLVPPLLTAQGQPFIPPVVHRKPAPRHAGGVGGGSTSSRYISSISRRTISRSTGGSSHSQNRQKSRPEYGRSSPRGLTAWFNAWLPLGSRRTSQQESKRPYRV